MVKLVVAVLLILSGCGICQVPAQAPSVNQVSSAREQAPRAQTPAAVREQTLLPDSINDVLWWLPEDTQTIMVARGPFKAPAPISAPPDHLPWIRMVDAYLCNLPLGIIQTIKDATFYKPLVGRTVLFGVEGSRKFRPPSNLGQMLYEGCDIVVLEQGLGAARDTLLSQMASQAKKVETIAGQKVMLFEEEREADIWTVFVCLPRPNVLLCATNRDFLTQVLNRMHQRGKARALPENLPEWKQVNTRARFWAVRHYDKADASEDPSSPLSGELNAANWPDTKALGIVFDFDPRRSNPAIVRYLSENKDALKLFNDEHKAMEQGFNPVIRKKADGVVEMVLPLHDEKGVSMSLLVLLALFGHAVYL